MLQEMEDSRMRQGLGSAPHTEFAVNVRNVLLDRTQTQDQALGNAAVGCPGLQEPQHFALPHREGFHP